MTYVNPIWLEGQRKRWLRHDWCAWVKPEAHHLYEPLEEKRVLRFDEVARRSAADAAAAREQEAFEQELLELRWLVKSVRLDLAIQRLQHKYDPEQPRVPAGSSSGGQWTKEGAGREGQEPKLTSKPAFLSPAIRVGLAARKGIEAALALYAWMSARNTPDSTAVLRFNAVELQPGTAKSDAAVEVDRLTREQVDEVFRRHGKVQEITDWAATDVRRGNYPTDSSYGTAVHQRIKLAINGPGPIPADANFVAEMSYLKSDEVKYGKPGSTRLDVFENTGTGTVCIYDVKTGESGLSRARMLTLASSAHSFYSGTKRIVIVEVRPRK